MAPRMMQAVRESRVDLTEVASASRSEAMLNELEAEARALTLRNYELCPNQVSARTHEFSHFGDRSAVAIRHPDISAVKGHAKRKTSDTERSERKAITRAQLCHSCCHYLCYPNSELVSSFDECAGDLNGPGGNLRYTSFPTLCRYLVRSPINSYKYVMIPQSQRNRSDPPPHVLRFRRISQMQGVPRP